MAYQRTAYLSWSSGNLAFQRHAGEQARIITAFAAVQKNKKHPKATGRASSISCNRDRALNRWCGNSQMAAAQGAG